MTFNYSSQAQEEDKQKEELDELLSKTPLVLPSSLVLPSGLQITSQGLPSLDKDKLDPLLHVVCQVDILSLPRSASNFTCLILFALFNHWKRFIKKHVQLSKWVWKDWYKKVLNCFLSYMNASLIYELFV